MNNFFAFASENVPDTTNYIAIMITNGAQQNILGLLALDI